MALVYEQPGPGALRQGEILAQVCLHRSLSPSIEVDDLDIESIVHPFVIVMHADCDLEQDYAVRFSGDAFDVNSPKLIPEILICDLFAEAEIRTRNAMDSAMFRRAKQNQDERYHRLHAASIEGRDGELQDFFIDFKRSFMERPRSLYAAIETGYCSRIAIVPPIYVHDLMHRFFGFHSRVGTPD